MVKGPRCRCCQKPLPKSTARKSAPREKNRWFPVSGWRYTGNLHVVSSVYTMVDGERRLNSVSVWDGESYRPKYKYFCTIKCAAEFGKYAVERGVA